MVLDVLDVVGVDGGRHVLVFLGVCDGFVFYIHFLVCLLNCVLDMVQYIGCDMMV